MRKKLHLRNWLGLYIGAAVFSLSSHSLSLSKAIAAPQPRAIHQISPLIAEPPTLPPEQAGYYYSASYQPVAYAAETATMIRFSPINFDLLPTLVVELPEGIELLGGVRGVGIEPPQRVVREGQPYRRYQIVPQSPQATKFTFFWRSKLPVGSQHKAYYYAEWTDGQQEEQLLTINIIDLPEGRTFDQIPVWYSIPSDMAQIWAQGWTDQSDYRRGGFNTLETWAYLAPNDKRWGQRLVQQVVDSYRRAGVAVWAQPGEWWWRQAVSTPAGQAVGIEGERSAALNLLYRGEQFNHWIAAGKLLVDEGIYTHVVDPEIYRQVDLSVGYSEAEKADFQQYLEENAIALQESDPSVFMRSPDSFPTAVRLWRKWRAAKYTDFFVEYREAIAGYMQQLGIRQPLRLVIYSTYHALWDSFYGYNNYEMAPPYLHTLEDPVDLSQRAFDVFSPMIYPDLFPASFESGGLLASRAAGALGRQRSRYDMLLPWQDTVSLRSLVEPQATTMPLLSTGFPFGVYQRDLSSEMVKYQVMEAIAGGAKGFGFWGEGVHDALDMATVGRLVDRLVPAEDIILNGTPFAGEPVQGPAFVKGVNAPNGSLLLVSEYSDRAYEVEIENPRPETSVSVVDIESGEAVAVLSELKRTFTVSLDQRRARMFWIVPTGDRQASRG